MLRAVPPEWPGRPSPTSSCGQASSPGFQIKVVIPISVRSAWFSAAHHRWTHGRAASKLYRRAAAQLVCLSRFWRPNSSATVSALPFAEMAYTVHYKRLAIANPSGGQIDDELKAWRYKSGHVMWELRRFVAALQYSGRLSECKLFLDLVVSFGLHHSSHFELTQEVVPSRKALAARGADASSFVVEAREEFQATTLGIVFILLRLECRRRGSGRLIARAIFRGWVFAFLANGFPEELLNPQLTDEERDLCGQPAEQPCRCPHMAEAVWAAQGAGENSADHLALLVLSISRASSVCAACDAWLSRAAAALAQAIDKSIPDTGGVIDPLRMGTHLASGSGRKRRYDEDYKLAVSVTAIQDKKAMSIAGFAQADAHLNPKTAKFWDHSSLGWYQAAAFANMSKVSEVSVTLDASRFGMPAGEYIMFAMSSVAVGRALWLPPQVDKRGLGGTACGEGAGGASGGYKTRERLPLALGSSTSRRRQTDPRMTAICPL